MGGMSAAWQQVPRSRLASARLRLADKLVLWSVVIGAMVVAYGSKRFGLSSREVTRGYSSP